MAVQRNWSTLNTTKLFYPPVPEDFVPRLRLQDLLNRIPRRPLTLVSAPAGYGKTTAACAWLKGCDLFRAWLSLDESDNDLNVFLTYFLAAIRRGAPSFGVELEAMLDAGILPTDRALVEAIFAELDGLDEGVVVVIDDCHLIRNGEVMGIFRELMRHPHPALHLVLLSRHDLPLPLSEWRARNQMIDVRAADLRFNLEETTAFLHRVTANAPDDATISILHKSTEGWVAGLRLALLSFAHIGEIDGQFLELSARNRHVVEYLAEQVFANLPADRQSFLYQTAILDRMCGPLCEAVASSRGLATDGQLMLQELYRENLFTVPLDDERQWFRYHHLFSEFLRSRLNREYSPEEVAGLHVRASNWFAANGFIEEAVPHALIAGETEQAVGLVAANRHDLLNREHWRRLMIWYNMFPEQVVSASPDLLLIKAWIAHALRYDIEEVRLLTDEIDALIHRLDLEPARVQLLLTENNVLRAIPHYHRLDAAASLAYGRPGLEVLPKAYYALRNNARTYAIGSLQMLGDLNGAYEAIRMGQQEDLAFPDYPRARNTAASGFLHWMNADLAAVEQMGEHILVVATTGDQHNSLSWGHYFLACVHYQRNNLDEAAYHAGQVFEARFLSAGISNIYGGFILALVHRATAKQDKVYETMKLVSAYAAEVRSAALMLLAQAFQAELDIMDGQFNRAAHFVEQFLPHIRPTAMPFFYGPQLTVPKALLAMNRPANAKLLADMLQRLRVQTEQTHNTRFLIEVLALEAMFHDSQGDERATSAALERSLALAEPSGFIRLYVDLGPRMKGLLGRMRHHNGSSNYIARILAAFPTTKPVEQETMIEPLTERELQVLTLLARRYSNKEIAEELFIAPVTVKRHTINIYQKLYVQGRREAVQTAQRLGLIT